MNVCSQKKIARAEIIFALTRRLKSSDHCSEEIYLVWANISSSQSHYILPGRGEELDSRG